VLKKLIKPCEEVERVNAELEKKGEEFDFIKVGRREEKLNFNLVSVLFNIKTKELIGDKLTIALNGNFEGKILTKVDKIIKEGEK
jgi:hypothetical protein